MSASPDHPLTLTDLQRWSYVGTALAVLGRPIAHSLSPVMHNAALVELARTQPSFRDWRYFKFDISPAELPTALALFHQKNFLGLNLTVPHKSLVLGHLTQADDFVHAAGAANTLLRTAAGWQGTNTDGPGLLAALREQFAVTPAHAEVILLGAGGAARGAALACLQAGCASLWIGNRTATTAQTLRSQLATQAGAASLHCFNPANPPANLPAGAIVINATSLGLTASDPAPLDLASIPRPRAVYDMIYRPAETALLRQAAAAEIPHANGLSMLIHQGAQALQLWTGLDSPVPVMQAAVQTAL